jgi:hypothetical protein
VSLDVDVAVVAWRYSTRERAAVAIGRARSEFEEAPFLVFGALSDSHDEGWVVLVGSPRKLDAAGVDEWDPGLGGERAELRADLFEKMARRYMEGGIVLDEAGDHEPLKGR